MTAAQIQARLALVQAAIETILTGVNAQATVAGRVYTRLDLDVLQRMEAGLERQLARIEGTSGGAAVARFQAEA